MAVLVRKVKKKDFMMLKKLAALMVLCLSLMATAPYRANDCDRGHCTGYFPIEYKFYDNKITMRSQSALSAQEVRLIEHEIKKTFDNFTDMARIFGRVDCYPPEKWLNIYVLSAPPSYSWRPTYWSTTKGIYLLYDRILFDLPRLLGDWMVENCDNIEPGRKNFVAAQLQIKVLLSMDSFP